MPRLRPTRRRALAVVTATLLVAACSGDPGDSTGSGATDAAQPQPSSSSPGTATAGESGIDPPATPSGPASPATSAATDSTEAGAPAWEEFATGFDALAATLVDPRSGDLLVVELGGRVRALDGTVLLDLSDRVSVGGEQGLLDATATPDGSRLVVHYSGLDGQTVLSGFPVGDDLAVLADPADETVLLTFDQPASNHNGGSVVFGSDGWLYFALGDGGAANDAFGNGADPSTPLGSILRLDVTTDPEVAVAAPDNPFVVGNTEVGGDPRVWAHGLRNPWRIATDGDRWFVTDVGQDAVEEVTVVPATTGPHDLGWPDWEGGFCRLDVCEEDSLQPAATLAHTEGACSIIGGAVAARPAVDAGQFLFTDLCDPRVWRLDPATGAVVEDAPLPDGVRPLALDLGADGAVVALTEDGRVLVRTRGGR